MFNIVYVTYLYVFLYIFYFRSEDVKCLQNCSVSYDYIQFRISCEYTFFELYITISDVRFHWIT